MRITYALRYFSLGIAKIISVTTIALAPIISIGQPVDDTGMLMESIAGHRYERRTYDASGAPSGRTVFAVSQVTEWSGGNGLEIRLTATSFDANDLLIGTDEVVWRCNPGAAEMFMNLLILAGDRFERDFRVTVTGGASILPPIYDGSTALADVQLDIELPTGFLRFLGTRTRITLTNRVITPLGVQDALEDEPGYKVLSDIQARVFLLRMPVKRYEMSSEEWVSASTGLFRQVVTSSDGRYSETQQLHLDD